MRRNRIPAIADVIKISNSDSRLFNKIICHALNIVAMIDIRQVIDFLKPFLPKLIYDSCPNILCFSGNVIN